MNINKNIIVLSALLTMAFTTPAIAAQVGAMTTFTSGTPAVAAEVNDNFTAVETAVNANDTAIAALKTGSVSVSAASFHPVRSVTGCSWDSRLGFGYFSPTTSGADCDAVSGISLPDGVILTGLSCWLYDNFAANAISVQLRRNTLSSGVGASIYSTASTVDSTSRQVLSDSSASFSNTVDNSLYTYSVKALFSISPFDALSLNGRVYGCTVSYR
ncbi:MAG: hypothetical protein QM484_04620 [Woeseiaceae bacterium]